MATATVPISVKHIAEMTAVLDAVSKALDALEYGNAIHPTSAIHRELAEAAARLTEIKAP